MHVWSMIKMSKEMKPSGKAVYLDIEIVNEILKVSGKKDARDGIKWVLDHYNQVGEEYIKLNERYTESRKHEYELSEMLTDITLENQRLKDEINNVDNNKNEKIQRDMSNKYNIMVGKLEEANLILEMLCK